jgi:hypothetical protein
MIFIETAIFTRRIAELLDEDDYFELQTTLLIDPVAGDAATSPPRRRRFSPGLSSAGGSHEKETFR